MYRQFIYHDIVFLQVVSVEAYFLPSYSSKQLNHLCLQPALAPLPLHLADGPRSLPTMTMAKSALGYSDGVVVVVGGGGLNEVQVRSSRAPPLHGPQELGIALQVTDDEDDDDGGGSGSGDQVSGATILGVTWRRQRLNLSPLNTPKGSGGITPVSPSSPSPPDGCRRVEIPSHPKRLSD